MMWLDYLCNVIISCEVHGWKYKADLSKGMDISLSSGPDGDNPNAFGIPPSKISPIEIGDFVGSVAKGSGANCDVIKFCAHGNITHTECIGHITAEHQNARDLVVADFVTADLLSIEPDNTGGQRIISEKLENILPEKPAEAIVIRTLPNTYDKKSKHWSGNHPPFFSTGAMQLLVNRGYKHLLTDLPSVDPEADDGKLLAHHVWWQLGQNPRMDASITELIFVENFILDGLYLLNLQFPKFQSDASPSRPVLFAITPEENT